MDRTLITSFFINSQQNEGSQLSKRLNISLSNGIQSSYAAISLPNFPKLKNRKYVLWNFNTLSRKPIIFYDRFVETDSEFLLKTMDFCVSRLIFFNFRIFYWWYGIFFGRELAQTYPLTARYSWYNNLKEVLKY